MENLVFVIIFIVSFMAICLMFFYMKKLQKLFFARLITKRLANGYICNSLVVEDVCKYIMSCKKNKRNKILKALSEGNLNLFYRQIDNRSINSKINLCAKKSTYPEKTKDTVYLLTLAKRYIKENAQNKALEILQKLKVKKTSQKQQAYYRYLMAQISLFEGDLLLASEDLNIVLKVFKRKKMFLEEAEAYFILGTIYRISGVYDTADFMLRASQEIYAYIGSQKGEAEAFGTLGLLMSAQERFDEAQDYFQKALDKSSNDKTLNGFISSQQAMLELVKGDIKKAQKIANNILKSAKNDCVKATVWDILSHIKLNEKKYNSAVKYAQAADEIFSKHKNYPASFESMYIKASALAYTGKLDEGEKVLRDLIEKEKTHKSCFHIAGAYTLLGLVLLKKNEPERAKAIFNQALSKELCNNRKTGVAIDYANLAIVEKMQGNNELAYENLQKALTQIKDIDEHLTKKIKDILD